MIDTEGLNDGESINSIQIQNLAKLMRNYERGVNAIVVVLNGQYDRFSQGVKDIIKFTYNAFSDKKAMNNMCIVFTRCLDPKRPNRQTKRTMYMSKVRSYLSEISGVPLSDVPEIPVFFVDCYPEEGDKDTPSNMVQFHGWVCSRKPLSTKEFKEAGYREDRVEETRTRISKGMRKEGHITYEMFEDQKRTKIIPNNREPPRFTDWVVVKKYEEPIKSETVEKRKDFDLGFKFSSDGKVRYKVTVDQERKITKDLKTGKIIKTTDWHNVSEEHKKEAGRLSEREETKTKKFEKKEVEHHYAHSLFGFSSNDHTHYKIYHVSYTEKRIIKIDYDGKETAGNWFVVPGSQKSIVVKDDRERGFTDPYEKPI